MSEDIRHRFNRLTFYTILFTFLGISMTFIIFSSVAQTTLTCPNGQFINAIGTTSDSCGIAQTYPLGTWRNFPSGSACANGNSSSIQCELMGNQSYRGILSYSSPNVEAGVTPFLQVSCITPSNTIGAVLQLQYANYSIGAHINITNFVNIGGTIPIDNSVNWPCPGNLIMNSAPLPTSVSAFIFRVVGLTGGGSGDNPRFSNLQVNILQAIQRVAASSESGISTTGFTERVAVSFPLVATQTVGFQWIATNGGTSTQSGSGTCSIVIPNTACTSAITFSPAFASTPNIVSTPTTAFAGISIALGAINLLSAQTISV